MPVWLVSVLQWVVGMALQHVSAADVKKVMANLVTALDAAVQSGDAKVTGTAKPIADEVALAFHEACVSIVDALSK